MKPVADPTTGSNRESSIVSVRMVPQVATVLSRSFRGNSVRSSSTYVLDQEVGPKESYLVVSEDRLGPEVHAPSLWKIPGQTSVGQHDQSGTDCLLFEPWAIQPSLANAPVAALAVVGGRSRSPEAYRRAVLPVTPGGGPAEPAHRRSGSAPNGGAGWQDGGMSIGEELLGERVDADAPVTLASPRPTGSTSGG
jgi:hypothetical protein